MILSDQDIQLELESGRLEISPIDDPDKQFQPASVDLRLSPEFVIFQTGEEAAIDPFNDDQAHFIRRLGIAQHKPFILHPGEFVLASTMEWVTLPDDLVARVDGRSSIGRLGVLMHATAGFIDPGFSGRITLELSNVNKMPVKLYPGMRCCQISFERMTSPAQRPYGKDRGSKYQGQRHATTSRISEDRPE